MSGRSFREQFATRFPDASAHETEILVTVAEQIVGEGAVLPEIAQGLLDVAETKLKEGL